MNNKNIKISPRLVIIMLIFIVVAPFLPLLISRRWNWAEAWIFAALYILNFVISRMLVARCHPDLLAERAGFAEHKNTKSWDKCLAPLVVFGGGFIPLVAGFDAAYGWSQSFGMEIKIISFVVMLSGYIIGSYALIKNRFFSGTVRIQTDRGHKVVSTGPYGWVRHPGYAGALLIYWATPFFLNTTWALIPVIVLTVLFIIRTHLEDRTLQAELEGYGDYAKRVRYRLIPLIW